MVGIYRAVFGLTLVAVSDNFESAVKALYDKYATDYDKTYYSPLDWWNTYKNKHHEAPHCYEIMEIEKW